MPEEKDYFNIKAVSSHHLQYFEDSPYVFKKKYDGEIEDEKKRYLDFGKQVHMRILEPERFKECYTVLNYELPKSEQQKLFCSTYVENNKLNKEERLIKAYTTSYSTKGKSDDKILQEATDSYNKIKDYIMYLTKVKKYKEVLSFAKKQMIDACYNNTLSHKAAREILFNDEFKSDNTLTYNELEILWKHPLYNIDCKSMLDRLIIDQTNKIIKIVDIKTTYSFKKFKESVYEFNYHRQMAFYSMAIYWYMKNVLNIECEDYKLEVYIVAINSNMYECKVFKLQDSDLNIGLTEINNIMSKLNWHFTNDLWEHTREYYEGNGIDKLE